MASASNNARTARTVHSGFQGLEAYCTGRTSSLQRLNEL